MDQAFPDWFNRQDVLSSAVNELRYTKQLGLQTIVDVTPINLGRDIRLLKEVSEKSGVNIIASTGFYHFDEWFLFGWNIENLVDQLIPEVEEGIQGTDIKPGVIKCASGTEITPTNEKLLRVAARLHKRCRLPVITHSSASFKTGIPQLEILLDEGVESGKLVIGHCGDTTDMVYLETLLASGCYIGLDRFGIEIVLSQDYIVFLDLFPEKLSRKRLDSDDPWTFHYILVDIIPKLINKGVSEKQIIKLTKENPKKILC
jgi:phosphotriesterase-related protein